MAKDIIHDTVGLSEKDAVSFLNDFGIKNIRIVVRNGEVFVFPAIVFDGVSLYIKNDKVYKAERG